MEALVTWIVGGFLLNFFINMKIESPDGKYPQLDKTLTFLFFKLLWPVGLIIFFLKWLQGKARIS